MKRTVCISGKLLLPLKEGYRAIIATCGTHIRTSPVIKIKEQNEDRVLFETMNAAYRVNFDMGPVGLAAIHCEAMCA